MFEPTNNVFYMRWLFYLHFTVKISDIFLTFKCHIVDKKVVCKCSLFFKIHRLVAKVFFSSSLFVYEISILIGLEYYFHCAAFLAILHGTPLGVVLPPSRHGAPGHVP